MSAHALPVGSALQEYRVEKLLGAGGFGLTYLATDSNLNLKVALKEYLPDDIAVRGEGQTIVPKSADEAESFGWGKQRFLDESRTLAALRHPNIVRVMRFFEANGSAYMVMEFVEGSPLTDWIKANRPLAEAQLLAVVGPLLEGLEVVHRGGYTHRDIKPANIYIREDGGPVLLDFGSARQKSSELTAVVSPGYAPFEQYHASGKQGPWSDLYALGGVMYWMLTGERPVESIARMRTDTLKPAVQAGDRSRYRAELLAAIDWALAMNEDERPQSVADLKKALFGVQAAPEPKTQKLATRVVAAPIEAGFLEKMETELAQHLGPIASTVVKRTAKKAASRTELIEALGAELPAEARAAFEKKYRDRSQPVSAPKAARADPSTALTASRFPQPVLDKAEQRLAEYIGAVARIVVKRAAMKARDEAELYLLIADEIEDKTEKKAFIRKAVSVSGKP